MWGHRCYKRADLLLRRFAVISHTYIFLSRLCREGVTVSRHGLCILRTHLSRYYLTLNDTWNLGWMVLQILWNKAPCCTFYQGALPPKPKGSTDLRSVTLFSPPQGSQLHTHIFPQRRNCSPKYKKNTHKPFHSKAILPQGKGPLCSRSNAHLTSHLILSFLPFSHPCGTISRLAYRSFLPFTPLKCEWLRGPQILDLGGRRKIMFILSPKTCSMTHF